MSKVRKKYYNMSSAFREADNVEELNVSGIPMETFDEQFWMLKNLKKLSINGTRLTSLPDEFEALGQLEELNLAFNHFIEFPAVLARMKHLKILNFNGNKISEWPQLLEKCPALEEIHIKGNWLEVFPGFQNIVCIKKINISNNRIYNIDAGIKNAVNLEFLDIADNEIETLPNELFQLKKLHTLHADRNHIKKMPLKIGQCTSLKYLTLAQNQITRFPAGLGKLKKLDILNVARNPIRKLPESLEKCISLNQIYASETYLSKLPGHIGNLKNLERIDVSFSNMKTIPDSIGGCKNLLVLNLEGNKIVKIPYDIRRCLRLSSLALSDNKISELPNSISLLPNLRHLDVSFNRLKKLPSNIAQLRICEHLDVSQNPLEDLPKNCSFKNLKEINIRGAKMKYIPGQLLAGKHSLGIEVDKHFEKEMNCFNEIKKGYISKRLALKGAQTLFQFYKDGNFENLNEDLVLGGLKMGGSLKNLLDKEVIKNWPWPLKKNPLGKGKAIRLFGIMYLKHIQLKERLEQAGVKLVKEGEAFTHALILSWKNVNLEALKAQGVILLTIFNLYDFLYYKSPLPYFKDEEVVEGLKALMNSAEDDSRNLALEIISSNGLPFSLWETIILNIFKSIRWKKKWLDLFLANAPGKFLKQKEAFFLSTERSNAKEIHLELSKLRKMGIDDIAIARYFFEKNKSCFWYLYKKNIIKPEDIIPKEDGLVVLGWSLTFWGHIPEECLTLELFQSVKNLNFRNNLFKRVPECIKHFKNANFLDLSLNPIRTLPKWLGENKGIKRLHFIECDLGPSSIRILQNMEQLEYLDISKNYRLRNRDILKLRRALPDCKIFDKDDDLPF